MRLALQIGQPLCCEMFEAGGGWRRDCKGRRVVSYPIISGRNLDFTPAGREEPLEGFKALRLEAKRDLYKLTAEKMDSWEVRLKARRLLKGYYARGRA